MIHDREILLLTGKMAYSDLAKTMSGQSEVSIRMLPLSVAAFTTPRMVQRYLSRHMPVNKPDIIFVSGMAQGDYSELENEFGIPVLKGTRNISNLPLLLANLDEVINDLSGSAPADMALSNYILEKMKSLLSKAEHDATFGVRNFKLDSGLVIGIDVRPKIMAEVVDATTRPFEQCIATAKYYAKYADIVDLGATISKSDPERIAELTYEIRKLGVSISIDSLNPKEIMAAVDAGAEIVLSIDYGNVNALTRLPENIAIVCLPTNVSKGAYPLEPIDRARKCYELSARLRRNGFSKILADPILEAPIQPGLMKSLVAFHEYRKLDQNTPFLAGFANVTEFIDSDTMGINAILSLLGVELGIAVFLSTEERPSTLGCISELQSTAQLAFLARMNISPPKELGITAFASKSREFSVQSLSFDDTYHLVEDVSLDYVPDPLGCFRISVDREAGLVLCEHRDGQGNIQRLASDKSTALLKEIVNRGLVGNPEHAAYLGAELMKAEVALSLGHDYQQDDEWSLEFIKNITNLK